MASVTCSVGNGGDGEDKLQDKCHRYCLKLHAQNFSTGRKDSEGLLRVRFHGGCCSFCIFAFCFVKECMFITRSSI